MEPSEAMNKSHLKESILSASKPADLKGSVLSASKPTDAKASVLSSSKVADPPAEDWKLCEEDECIDNEDPN